MAAEELAELLKKAKASWDAMTPEARKVMMRQQREGYVRAEMSWPKPNFHWEGNTKVYHSMEDYYND